MTVYGYIGKSYSEETADQFQKLNGFECDVIFVESPENSGEPQKEQLLTKLTAGDKIVIANLTVFQDGLKGLVSLLEGLDEKSVQLISIDEGVASKESLTFYESAKMISNMLTEQKRSKTRRWLEKTQSEGKRWGRPRIKTKTIEHINYLYFSKKLSMREIAEECNVALGTVHKYLNKDEADLE